MMGGHGMFHGTSRGVVDEEVFGKAYDQRVIRRLIPYVMPYKHLTALATVAMFIYVGTQVAIPWIIKTGIDGYVGVDGGGDFGGLALVFAIFMGSALLNWASNFTMQMAMTQAGQKVLYDIRSRLFRHVQKLSLKFFDNTEVGRIMSRVQGDVWQLQEFMSLAVMTLGDVLSLAGIVVALLVMNLKLGLITMVVLPLLIGIMAVWQVYARRAFMRVRLAISIVNGALNENITGVRVVQSMNRQERNLELFDYKNQENLDSNLAASRLSSGLMLPVDMLTGVAIGLAIFFGARMVTGDELGVGALIAFVLYIQRFFDPIRNLTMMYTQLQRSMASGTRIFELLDTEPDFGDRPGAKVMPRLRGEIELRNVTYSYVPGEDVLKDVSLQVQPGETVAIVGPTGAGKTTLVSLMSRFYDVARGHGAVLVDGHDVRDVTRDSYVSQMSMVLQEPFLFSVTVRENIKYKHVDATDAQMVEAARSVGAHDFIMRLENGYDTLLQERGGNLSVGQRQLISFARAIVADPRILILDEATANIDSYTEMLVQRALHRLLEDRTAIVIAHRLSTIRGADRILVLDQGEIAEDGNHKQLMEKSGLYQHLYRMNFAAIEEPLLIAGDD
jgi:ATP-binding cassette subfamily B protein